MFHKLVSLLHDNFWHLRVVVLFNFTKKEHQQEKLHSVCGQGSQATGSSIFGDDRCGLLLQHLEDPICNLNPHFVNLLK